MPRVYLIGFMGAGKTTVGKQLARKIKWSFADTDSIAERELGMTVNEVFNELGEEWFRKYEQKVLIKTTSFKNTIISTGGGTPCFNDNIDTIINNGLCIYLHMPNKSIVARLLASKRTRPLVYGLSKAELDEYVEKKMAEREEIYSKAHFTVNALAPDLIYSIKQCVEDYFRL